MSAFDQQDPFLHPGMYNPGQFMFGNNAELSQLISMFAGPLLGQMAGPGNFLPHMMPGQALFDQFTMRNYQNQTRMAAFNLGNAQTGSLSNTMLGLRSIMTREKASDLNREQATTMAGFVNNPMIKGILGMAVGPENMEALLHGSRGDVQNLGNAVSRIGYFRRDPDGSDRMDAESLEDLTTGVFSHLYEPQGDLDRLATRAREGDKQSLQRLREASQMEDKVLVSDESVTKRLLNKGKDEVDLLYKKYVQGGEATDAATQAKELTKYSSALRSADVIHDTETTVGMMQSRAEKIPTEQMHGFMAGQVGQLVENLSQRGILPRAIGTMSGSERVKAIAETKLDDATLDRMAQKMAQRDLEKGESAAGKRYLELKGKDSEKAQAEINAAAAGYSKSIKETQKKAEEFAAGKSGVKVEDVLQGIGGEQLAGNVDASRVSSKLKDYTGALAAVRDIFGDNGNPNAPMPALLAALDNLTQGGMGQMKPADVATMMRQMQTLARETGTSMQQLGQMSAVAGNMGQQLGLSPRITTQNVLATMGYTKAALERGAFGEDAAGGFSKEEFQIQTTKLLQAGDASGNAKAMAAMASIYAADPKKYAGTELEAAVQKYNDPSSDGTYTYTDPKTGQKVTKNLYQEIGQGRQFAAAGIVQNSGATAADFEAQLHNPLALAQHGRAGAGMMTQKHEILQTLTQRSTLGAVGYRLRGTDTLKNMSHNELSSASEVVTQMVIDSAKYGTKQADYLRNNMKEKLKAHFIAQKVPEAEAEKRATEMSEKITGDRTGLNTLIGNLGITADAYYGTNMVRLGQSYGDNTDVAGRLEVGRSEARAEAQKRMLGYETTPVQRMADYFNRIGKNNESFNLGEFVHEMMPTVKDKKLLMQFGGNMGAGMQAVELEANKHRVTNEHIDTLIKNGDEAELRKLADLTNPKVQIVKDATIDAALKTKVGKLSDEDLDKAYEKITDSVAGSAKAVNKDVKQKALRESAAYKAEFTTEYMNEQNANAQNNNRYVSQSQLHTLARDSLGKALEGADHAGQLIHTNKIKKAFEQGKDADILSAGVESLFEINSFKGALKDVDRDTLKKEIMNEGNSREAILKMFNMSEKDYQEGITSAKPSDKHKAVAAALALDSAPSTNLSQLGETIAQSVESAMQNINEAKIDAGTVVINTGKIEGEAGGKQPDKPLDKDGKKTDEEIRASQAGASAVTINAEQTAGATVPDATAAATTTTGAGGGGYASANISPAATNSLQQQPFGHILNQLTGATPRGAENITVSGNVTFNGLREGVLELIGPKGVSTPGNAPPIIPGAATTSTK